MLLVLIRYDKATEHLRGEFMRRVAQFHWISANVLIVVRGNDGVMARRTLKY